MKNKKISDDFFKNAILRGDIELFDSFSPSVVEKKVGPDTFFDISKDSAHRKVNERITKLILSRIPINSSAYGFVQGKSYFDYLKPHISGYYFLRLDVRNFFHSISVPEVKSLLADYFSNDKREAKYSALDIATTAVLHKTSKTCPDVALREKEILPIGFPSSPVISNILFRKIDILIQKYCENKNITYTRYADDLLFSSAKSKFIHCEQFEKEISIFISMLSLNLKARKRKATENTISLNGYVIQNTNKIKPNIFSTYKTEPIGTIRLSDKKLKIIKKLEAHLRKKHNPIAIMESLFDLNYNKFKNKYKRGYGFYKMYANSQLQNKLKGYRSYLVSLIKFDDQHHCVDKKCLNNVVFLAKSLENHIAI